MAFRAVGLCFALSALSTVGRRFIESGEPEPSGAALSEREGVRPGPFRPLTAFESGDLGASALSPSGKSLLTLADGALTLLDVETGKQRRLGSQRIQCAVWYPDEGHLLVSSQGDLFKLEVNAGATSLLGIRALGCPSISPDGRLLAAIVPNGVDSTPSPTARRLRIFDLEQPAVVKLEIPLASGSSSAAAWSPDSQWLGVYERDGDPLPRFVAIHALSGSRKVLVELEAYQRGFDLDLVWLGTWELVYYARMSQRSAYRRGNWNAVWSRAIDPQTLAVGEQRLIAGLSRDSIYGASTDAKGQRLALHLGAGRPEALSASLSAAGQLGALRPVQAAEVVRAFKDDETLIAYDPDSRPRRYVLRPVPTNPLTSWWESFGGRLGFLPRDPVAALGGSEIFDRDQALFRELDAEGPEPRMRLYRSDLDGSRRLELEKFSGTGDGFLLCGRASRTCFWAEAREQSCSLQQVDTDSGELSAGFAIETPTRRNVGSWVESLAVSPDGTAVAVGETMPEDTSAPKDDRVRFLDLQGRTLQTARLPQGCFAHALTFAQHGGGVYASSTCLGEQRRSALFWVGRDGVVTELEERTARSFLNAAVSPGGTRIAVTLGSFENHVWLADLGANAPRVPAIL